MALTCLFYQRSSATPPPSAWRRWSCWTWPSGCPAPLRTASKWVPALWRWRNAPAHFFSWPDSLTGRHGTTGKRGGKMWTVKQTWKEFEIVDFIVKICSPPSMFIAIDISAIDCSLLAGRSSKQRPRASIRDVSMLDLLIESGIFCFCSGRAAERTRTETTRRSVASRDGRSTAYPRDRNKEDTISGCVAGHLQALLTQDFLSQLRARSRDGGGAVTGHVGHVGHYGHKWQLFFQCWQKATQIRDKPFL